MIRAAEFNFSVGMLWLLIFLITQYSTGNAQGTEAYFNGSSYVLLFKSLNLQGRTSLSFRTCSSGQLLQQNGVGSDFIELALLPTGELRLNWEVHSQDTSVLLGHGLINNHWHDVDLIHNLGSVTLTVDKQSIIVANNTYNSDFFNLQLESSHPNVFVGRGYTGCILQGAGVVLNVSSIESYTVTWGKCPLPDKGDCDGYLVDHCFSQPCHKLSQCVTLPGTYKCVCTTRYSGPSCDIDLGPLCEKLDYNQCQNEGVCQEDKSGNSTSCICLPKFTGTYCETRIDNTFCDTQPCRNGGICNINQFRDNYVCSCPQGFAGVDCELNIDECQSFPCQNNGSCTDEINSYTCDCTGTGYRGPNCDININECEESNPCYTGSMCFDRYGDYICDCPPGFGGKNCDQEVNECDSSPCQNAGSCIDNLNGYLCNCALGFAGISCEINIDDCLNAYCPNNTHCVDGMNTFSCVCNPGYTGAVPHCVEINECASGPCLNGGSCHDGLSDFSCSCIHGFIGRFCEVNVDECASNPCINGATCVDGIGQYNCGCVPGFTGINCDVDINECDPNPCQNSLQCTDMVNDYFCECIPGWEGKNCNVNFDECVSKPCLHGSCVDLLNNFTCSCNPGYSGRYCEENINECDSSPCFNGGTCTDLIADFSCQCASEFMGKTCSKVYNACQFEPCENGGSCQTIVPSHQYTCNCPLGFNGHNCEVNIDECKEIVCPQGQMCFDMVNAYECRCPTGFTGSDCSININECSSNPCANGTCIDGIGNYMCECPHGLTGKRCETDINECESSPCMNGLCQNLQGSFLCYCRPGFTGTTCNIEFNECLSSPCKNNATCNDLVNDYNCSCLPGFSGRNCETDINECEPQPCQNGATCSDLINRYECTCIPGFTGVNCELNIDECATSPCLNGGACIDLINKFECNCTDSGFIGIHCETNIDDCASNPCRHGSSCEDGIKDYNCHCYTGYEGKNCEIDIPECTSSPCLNSALCLEYSNTTLYDMNYLGFFPSFSYDKAGGYRCVCSLGFTGVNCETNIDDCEINTCSAHGQCIDKINDYYCACLPGYEGQYCGTEINECDRYKPCQNEAQCKDLIDDYSCACPQNFGDKNCSTFLRGCNDNKCENNATCKPLLLEDGSHGYICLCPSGYKGSQCEKLTTVSFQGNGMWNLKPSSFRFENYVLDLHFRTTLPDGIIAQGFMPEPPLEYILYLWKSYVYLGVYNNTGLVAEVASRRGQNDSFWKHVIVTFNSDEVMLNVSGKVEQSNTSRSLLFNFYTVMGASSPDMTPAKRYLTKSIPQFVGCIQDVFINDEIEIPDFLEMNGGIELGCPREEQCGISACMNGRCQDNWISYECICSRPYFGKHCEYSHIPATFGYRNQSSGSVVLNIPYEVQSNMSDAIEITFFLRTRKAEGLVFYLGSLNNDHMLYSETEMPNTSFMIARLLGGKLQVVLKTEYANPEEVLLDRKLDNGDIYFLQVSKNHGVLTVSANDSTISKPVPNYSLESQVLYISGFPDSLYRSKRQLTPMSPTNSLVSYTFNNITHFKGVIQDFRINNMVVVFYPLNDSSGANSDLAPKELGVVTMNMVYRGVVSDDLCQPLNPCFHAAPCNDIWNEYTCDCPKGYRGKNCDEEEPCNRNTCPVGSECQNLLEGYECVAPASFNGNDSSIQYKVHNISGNITNITFSYRSKDLGTILWLDDFVSFSGYFLHVELLPDSIDVKWDFGNPPGTTKTASQKINDDGEWQHVEILFKEAFVQLNLNGKVPMLSEDTHLKTLDQVLSNQPNLYLGYSPEGGHFFKGCMREVRINGHLLPFFPSHLIPDTGNPFLMYKSENVRIGCILCWNEDCDHGLCINETESYACNCNVGYEGQFCTVDMCDSRQPCKNHGICSHTQDDIICQCTEKFTGIHCSIANLCASYPCENNGRCTHDIERNDYNCTCTEEFEGKNCEKRTIVDCDSSPCEHGTCINMDTDSPLKYKCLCDERYEGQNCDEVKDLCQSNPCKHSGICVMNKEHFHYECDCKSGYEGAHCEVDINECETGPGCMHGECIDEVNSYSCICYPGYFGRNCQEKIYRCEGKVCFNGTCRNTDFGYECTCAKGYFGKHCNVHNDCNAAVCNSRGECNPLHDETERYFDFNCSCTDGYSGKSCAEKLSVSGDDDTSLVLMILIPVMCLFILCLLIGAIVFLRMAKKKRATRGTYSPSRQEMFGSRVEMNHVMKPPPEERLI